MTRKPHHTTTRDRVRISFDLYSLPSRDNLLIICPGFFQNKETAIFQRMAAELAEDRDVLCMDFRGHGRSGGLYTFSAKEGADLEAVLAWARDRYSAITLLSFSLGGAVAINTAARSPGSIRALIAVSAPSAFERIEFRIWNPEVIYGGIRAWDHRMGCRPGNPLLKKDRPADTIRRVEAPVLLIHGTRDRIVGHRHSERLYKAASGPKRLELIQGGGHAEELYRNRPNRLFGLVNDWLHTNKLSK